MTINWFDLISGVLVLLLLYFGLDIFSGHLKKKDQDTPPPSPEPPSPKAPKKR